MLPAGIPHLGTSKSARLMKGEGRDSVHQAKSRKQRAWRVVHAAESSGDLLPLIEGQIAFGMRPVLLTPAGSGFGPVWQECRNGTASRISLLQSWNRVREWRKILQEGTADIPADVIHAHSFPAGMAAVRNSSGVVYQLRRGFLAGALISRGRALRAHARGGGRFCEPCAAARMPGTRRESGKCLSHSRSG